MFILDIGFLMGRVTLRSRYGVSKRVFVYIGVIELFQCFGVLQKLRYFKNKRGYLGRKKSVLQILFLEYKNYCIMKILYIRFNCLLFLLFFLRRVVFVMFLIMFFFLVFEMFSKQVVKRSFSLEEDMVIFLEQKKNEFLFQFLQFIYIFMFINNKKKLVFWKLVVII